MWSVRAAAAAAAAGRNAAFRARGLAAAREPGELELGPREALECDVCVVGAGPAGLASAIRLKQLDAALAVTVLEKGGEVGAHVLSGNVLEPRALDELLPRWREQGAPAGVEVSEEASFFLAAGGGAVPLPTPPPMHNAGNRVVSLSRLVRWLGDRAEELGVEVYPGFAASEVLYDEAGAVRGVATGDMGWAKDGSRRDNFERGIELHAKATLLSEGCRGSLSEEVIRAFGLRGAAGADPQTYGLGIKEVWEVDPDRHAPGRVWHSVGYPLDFATYGGGFLYHMEDRKVALGLVVGLDYRNPYLSPFQEFQKFKAHPKIRAVLEGGQCVQYGARTLVEGGIQSLPRMAFPGGALLGCAAGTLNAQKIKGTHTAMKSGMLAAEAVHAALAADSADFSAYDAAFRASWAGRELQAARNFRPGFRRGLVVGALNAGLEGFVLRGRAPWTLRHAHADHEALGAASEHAPIQYPKPDGEVTFDLPTSLFRSGTNHDHHQPAHLRLRDAGVPERTNLAVYDGPEQRFCPAGVYEYLEDAERGGRKCLQINAQNCLHCKACDIKDPTQNIRWTVPEGGGGPAYTMM